jgi:hypothetical protein
VGFEEVRGKGEATEDHMDRYRSESKLKVTWKFRDSSHVDEATLAYFGAFLLFRFLAVAVTRPAAASPYCTAVVVKNTRMQVLQKEL